MHNQIPSILTCQHCGNQFVSRKISQRFCSRAHAKLAVANTTRNQLILSLLAKDFPACQIARQLGISRQRVHQIKIRAEEAR